MRWLKTLIWMAAFLFVIFFSLQNKEEVTVRFGLSPILNQQWVVPPIPLFLALLGSLFLGVLIGGVADLFRGFQLRRNLAQHQRTIEMLEKELRSLRSPPGD
jgi:uncharacterized integral membrane protein